MRKRYDYHSIDQYMPVLILMSVMSITVIVIAFIVGQSVLEKIVFTFLGLSGIAAVISTYLKGKNTFIELNDDGILFNGWSKRYFSVWSEVREIKRMTPIQESQRYKIYTEKGSFAVSRIESADSSKHSPWEGTNKEAAKATEELIEEIKQRSPHVKLTYSLWNRPL